MRRRRTKRATSPTSSCNLFYRIRPSPDFLTESCFLRQAVEVKYRRLASHGLEGEVSLGLNDNPPIGAFAPEVRHKSAGLAFALSLLIPGVGQFYCGKTGRGWITLVFWVLGLPLCFSRIPNLRGVGLVVIVVLWIFSFLDAYFTAIEINAGRDAQVDVQNPRVAVTLNLLTAGLGYFYLGEKWKGIAIFVGTQIALFGVPRLTGFAGGVFSLALIVAGALTAADAYRIASIQLKEALGPETGPPAIQPPSRLPAFVPIALACVLGAGFIVMSIVGLAIKAARGPAKHAVAVRAKGPFGNVWRAGPKAEPPGTPYDLSSAVNSVQWLERKTERTKDDIRDLKLDEGILASVLKEWKLNRSDAVVAHYYRAQAVNLMNSIHMRAGEGMDLAGSRRALQDLDAVIADGGSSYVPAVKIANAQYLAGGIARNQLHDEPRAYAYWDKCAWSGHAGCVNVMAAAKVTGVGGQKVDIDEALKLYTTVFETGIRYRCAGAFSALNIAEVIYFTGVRRPGDDELEWLQKSYGLMDKLEVAEGNQNACQRSEIELEDFLFRLSRGERNVELLGDATGREDGNSAGTKAVIQLVLGATDAPGFEAAVQANKWEGARCSAYFDAMWYEEIMKDDALARRYHQRMEEIGKFHCGTSLVYASKFKM
jgi:hypothetical protein